ncbi:MAG: PIN domain-containing protein [Trueperaceae bacterium]|nr:PIN domain-containing protein [Trueperaceae bacterium]
MQTLLFNDPGPFIVPMGILGEITYLIEKRLGHHVLEAFIEDLAAGSFQLDCGEPDLSRISQLIKRYADLPLGYADAAVIACAERSGKKVLTLDFKHFSVVEREGKIEVLPQR